MPSEQEIEEAVWHVYNHEDNDGGIGTLGSARVLLDAYLSMKSERDKYKQIVEKDTVILKRIDSFPEQTTSGITIREMTLVSLAHNALSLRDKKGSR
jgi:hypothetical protein